MQFKLVIVLVDFLELNSIYFSLCSVPKVFWEHTLVLFKKIKAYWPRFATQSMEISTNRCLVCFSGFKSHRNKWGSPGAERPVPKSGQGDDAVLHSCTHRAEFGAPRRCSEFLQSRHRPDPHHSQQRWTAAPARHPAGPRCSDWRPRGSSN